MATFYNATVKNVDTSDVTLITSDADSTIVLSVLVANVNGSVPADVTVSHKDSSDVLQAQLAYTVAVPNDSAVEILANKYILPSGRKLTVASSASGDLDAHISYVVV